jgi:hypothetical protein
MLMVAIDLKLLLMDGFDCGRVHLLRQLRALMAAVVEDGVLSDKRYKAIQSLLFLRDQGAGGEKFLWPKLSGA